MRQVITPKPQWLIDAHQTAHQSRKAGKPFAAERDLRRTIARFAMTATLDTIVELIVDLSERSDDWEAIALNRPENQG